jgi:lantibiotic modifying enzyme
VVRAIADCVRVSKGDGTAPAIASEPSLAGGAAGLAVLFAYLAQADPTGAEEEAAKTWLARAVGAVSERPVAASLYNGLAGVAWAAAHLGERLPDLDTEGTTAEIDEVLIEHLDQSPWTETYDLIGGLVGFGVYALERRPRPAATACLERVVGRLAETAEHRPEGITWVSCAEWLPADARAAYPPRHYNLGLAHGVPAVIALLGQACAAGVAEDTARPLLDGAVRWLPAQQVPGGFPYGTELESPAAPARLAWCYGDPGVAVALLLAARCAGEPSWEREALAVARRAAERSPDEAGVVDAGLCHGAAGLGHLFNRMYQATGEAPLGEAACFWFRRTLEMRQPGRGIAGYAARRTAPDGTPTWEDDPGLLTGVAGIALALLAAATPLEPAWDRVLLVSTPVPGAA